MKEFSLETAGWREFIFTAGVKFVDGHSDRDVLLLSFPSCVILHYDGSSYYTTSTLAFEYIPMP